MAATKRRTFGVFLAFVGMIAGALGLALPWGRAEGPFTTEELSAFDLDDGVVVAALLALSAATLAVHVTQVGPWSRWSGLAAFVCGIAITGIAVVDVGDVGSVETIVQSGGGEIDTTVGEGLFLVLGGGVAQVVGMAIVLGRGRRGPYGAPGEPFPVPEAGETREAGVRDAGPGAAGREPGGSLGG